jgi:hypothetical protein
MPQFLKYSPHILGTSTCCDLHMNTGQGGGVQGGGCPQIVWQTRPVGQYSLHSRAILAYYQNK